MTHDGRLTLSDEKSFIWLFGPDEQTMLGLKVECQFTNQNNPLNMLTYIRPSCGNTIHTLQKKCLTLKLT